MALPSTVVGGGLKVVYELMGLLCLLLLSSICQERATAAADSVLLPPIVQLHGLLRQKIHKMPAGTSEPI
jgi:hypothetical protein